jgi:hypothetical protein
MVDVLGEAVPLVWVTRLGSLLKQLQHALTL